MKAVLVVNIPEDWLKKEVCINISSLNTSIKGGMSFNTKLKLLPEKKETRHAIQYSGLAEEYRKEGWNECLDEILGESK